MNAPRIIPEAVRRLQIAASDPATSAWVAANAGSGKTHVLAQRVIRLLLDGVDPARILCITFTKLDAAAEAQLLNESSLGVLLDAALDPDAPLGRALAAAIAVAADRTFKEVVAEAIGKRDIVRVWIDHGGSVDRAVAVLCGTLGIR